jgi:hypothetical protein
MPKQPLPPSRRHQAINQAALFLCLLLAFLGILRLLTALFSNDILPLRPLDGWLLMLLRALAVCFALSMFLIRELRQRYFLVLLALVILTAAGLWLRLASLLPKTWQAAAGVAQLLMTVSGLGLIIAGLFQGEDLAGFIQDTWALSVKQVLDKLGLGNGQDT